MLVPINGSRNDAHAMRQLANEFAHDPTLEVHLLNVRTPLRTDVSQFLRRDLRDDFYEDEARKVLKNACEALEKHRIPYSTHIRIGDKGEAIVEEARRLECARILMSTARKNSLTRMLEDSTTEKVLARTTVPVEIVAGDKVSRLEEIGWPAGVAVAIAIFVVAAIY
ncbi:MAG TPA: universal stress protein [Casimicrobiaceae bacterium]|nr:universal stress protein [Casimicrobiaceae bacterium]